MQKKTYMNHRHCHLMPKEYGLSNIAVIKQIENIVNSTCGRSHAFQFSVSWLLPVNVGFPLVRKLFGSGTLQVTTTVTIIFCIHSKTRTSNSYWPSCCSCNLFHHEYDGGGCATACSLSSPRAPHYASTRQD